MASQAQGVLSNPICSICEKNEASLFCKCTDTPTLFCMQCFPAHHAKYPRTLHQVMPVAALRQDPQEYMRKNQALTKAVAQLQKNLERVEQYCVEFADLMQNCINYLTEYRTWGLQQLQTEKEELALAVETAIQEATNCMDQGVEPVSALGRAMLTLPTEELQVFSYTVSTPDLPTLCQSWAHYQNHLKTLCERFNLLPEEVKELPPSQVPRDLFAAIGEGNSMQLYDFHTHNTTQHTLPIQVHSGYIQVDRTTVLIVGREVLTLDLLTLQITPLPSLLTPRGWVGVAQLGNTVFAFGGGGLFSPMTVCEKSSIPPTHWTPLPPMHYARSYFTPCVFKALLYLAAGDHKAVESFSPLTETFTVLPVSLPPDLKLSCSSVAFVANGELFLLTNHGQMARWKIENEAHFCVSNIGRSRWSFHPPLIMGTEVYIANNASGGKVEKWSLDANKFV